MRVMEMKLVALWILLPLLALSHPDFITTDSPTECDSDADCNSYGEGKAFCDSGECQCMEHYVLDSTNTTCLAVIGGECENDDDCDAVKDGQSECAKDGFCRCFGSSDYASLDFLSCHTKAEQDSDGNWECNEDDECGFIIDTAVDGTEKNAAKCENDKCKCQEDHWFIHYEEDQMYIYCARGIGASCVDDNYNGYMIDHAVCNNETDTYECETHYVADESKTRCPPVIGGECEGVGDCKAVEDQPSACDDGVCICPDSEDYASFDYLSCHDKAWKNSDGVWSCSEDIECGFIIDGTEKNVATCVKEECKCHEDDWFIHDIEDQMLIYCERELGASCNLDEDCQRGINNTECHDGKCRCKTGYTQKDDTKTECSKGTSGASAVHITSVTILSILATITKAVV